MIAPADKAAQAYWMWLNTLHWIDARHDRHWHARADNDTQFGGGLLSPDSSGRVCSPVTTARPEPLSAQQGGEPGPSAVTRRHSDHHSAVDQLFSH